MEGPGRSAARAGVTALMLVVVFGLGGPSASPNPATDGNVALWRVVVLDGESGAELWSAPARTGDVVVYGYVHSSAKTPIESRLRVEKPGAGFVVEQERYQWYGPGVEFRADRGVFWEDGWYVVPLDRPVERLVVRVAATVEQRLAIGSVAVALGELAPEGRRLVLEVRP